MKDYYLNLVGLRMVLRTPFEITISDNLRPFLCGPHEKTDCIIVLQSVPTLPPLSENGMWHGVKYYQRLGNRLEIFHCHAHQGAAFAMTRFLENNHVEICVLPDCLSYFTGTTGIFNCIGLETLLLQHRCLLLHASVIKYRGKAVAFSGPSGVGKSTQAELWRTCFGADIINGDRAALRRSGDSWMAYGSPYAGTSGIYKNDQGVLAAIILLRQAEENRLHRLTETEAFRQLYPQLSVHHWDKSFVANATDLCLQMLENTPVYLLECRPEESAAALVKEGLSL